MAVAQSGEMQGDWFMKIIMSRKIILLAAVVSAAVMGGCGQEKVMLWNGRDFTGWKLFVPDKNVDVHKVWTVRDGVVYCSGVPKGYMRTVAAYGNYDLHVEWRWVEKPTNSGVLLHAQGKDKVWPRCIEAQLMNKKAGDLVLMDGTGITIGGKKIQDKSKEYIILDKKKPCNEKPAGEWNSYDIHCGKDGCIRLCVNGEMQNEGFKATQRSGWIGLQSEGSPIEFRNIYIKLLRR